MKKNMKRTGTQRKLSLPAYKVLRDAWERGNFCGGMIRMAESCHAERASVKFGLKRVPWRVSVTVERRRCGHGKQRYWELEEDAKMLCDDAGNFKDVWMPIG